MTLNSPLLSVLARSGLQPGHVIVLMIFPVFIGDYVLRELRQAGHVDGSFGVSLAIGRAVALLVAVSFLALSRDLRVAMGHLFGPPARPVEWTFLLLAMALAYSWCIGVYPVLLKWPLVAHDPGYFAAFFQYREAGTVRLNLDWAAYALAACAATPVLEELIDRGLLLNAWRLKRTLPAAIVLSSLVFGLMHGRHAIMALGLGVVLCLVYLRYESLWPPILVHAAYNFVNVLPAHRALVEVKPAATITHWSAWAWEIALAAAFVPLAFLFWRRLRPA